MLFGVRKIGGGGFHAERDAVGILEPVRSLKRTANHLKQDNCVSGGLLNSNQKCIMVNSIVWKYLEPTNELAGGSFSGLIRPGSGVDG